MNPGGIFSLGTWLRVLKLTACVARDFTVGASQPKRTSLSTWQNSSQNDLLGSSHHHHHRHHYDPLHPSHHNHRLQHDHRRHLYQHRDQDQGHTPNHEHEHNHHRGHQHQRQPIRRHAEEASSQKMTTALQRIENTPTAIQPHKRQGLTTHAALTQRFSLAENLAKSTDAMATQPSATPLPHTLQKSGIQEICSIEGVTEFRLLNGLRILLAPDNNIPLTTVNMVYLAGSRHDKLGQTGTAHLLEHQIFQGTPNEPDALSAFSRHGILEYNGVTNVDSTSFYAVFPSHAETLRWFIGWLADTMVNATLANTTLATEMPVVLNEMEELENHNNIRFLIEHMHAVAFTSHNYGHRPIGTRVDIEHATPETLRDFYETHYRPDNVVLILTGKFNQTTALQMINETLGQIPCPKTPLPREHMTQPVQKGEIQVTLRDQGGVPIAIIMFRAPPGNTRDALALSLAANMLIEPSAGQIYNNTVLSNLNFRVETGNEPFLLYRDESLVFFSIHLHQGMDPDVAVKILTKSAESISDQPFTQKELERARRKWLNSWMKNSDSPKLLSEELAQAVARGEWRAYFLQRDWARNITLAEVNRVAKAYFVPANRIIGQYIPTANLITAPRAQYDNLKDSLKNYRGDPFNNTLITAFDPTPKNIDAHTQHATLPLANGQLTLALLPKPNRSHRVAANLLIRFGNVSSLSGQQTVADAVVRLLNKGVGTPTLDREAIRDKFDQLQAEVKVGKVLSQSEIGFKEEVLVSLETTRQHFAVALETLLDMIRRPVFTADQVEAYKFAKLTAIQNDMASPSALVRKALGRQGNIWSKDHIRYVPSFSELLTRVRGLSAPALTEFHAKFYGANALLFSATGDFDVDQAKDTLQKSLADWPQGMPYTRVPHPFHTRSPRHFQISIPGNANGMYRAELLLNLQDTAPDYPALFLANFLLGAAQNSRLWQRIREKEGLTYNIQSSLPVSSFEPKGILIIEALCAPDKCQRVKDRVQEALILTRNEGFTQTEINQGITEILNALQYHRFENKNLALQWTSHLTKERQFAWEEDRDNAIRNLTKDQVDAALRQLVDPNKFSTAIAADFEAKEKAPSQIKPTAKGG